MNYIENDCEMEEIYKKRVDTFFKYHDRNNSRRVYEEILKLDTYY
jgi:CDP-glycerol glycerophosphotransferase (TagB/SpsB family)